jgi:transcriptional regulator with PAS, ATPase and Fis domain
MEIQSVKQRFAIIGNSPALNRAIEVAVQVAPTDISVLINGESGTGKEVMPQIIHNLSHRKHNKYIAVNCGAIPEGTIDSEFFGHEKGSFTGASESRKVRLLRVLETGEFIKVGSSKILKTDVRIVAATNKDLQTEIERGKFREDLYYRLNTVPILLPPLRKRKEDILLIFRKFAVDFSDKYRMPPIFLDEESQRYMALHDWPGNIRQLKNLTEQMSVIEKSRNIDIQTLMKYLPREGSKLPAVIDKNQNTADMSEREILYKVLFDMKSDMAQLKGLVADLMNRNSSISLSDENEAFVKNITKDMEVMPKRYEEIPKNESLEYEIVQNSADHEEHFQAHEEVEESLSIADKEKELIIKALEKNNNRRKKAAEELGISERTLYRKIKEYDIA